LKLGGYFKEPRLQHHGSTVALRHYDKELPSLKANAVVWMSELSNDKLEVEDIPAFIEEKRRKRDEEDRVASLKTAKETLAEFSKKSHPVRKRTGRWNIKPEEREMFQQVLSDPTNKEMSAATLQDRIFPSDGRGETGNKGKT
jgi:hypothetical protein